VFSVQVSQVEPRTSVFDVHLSAHRDRLSAEVLPGRQDLLGSNGGLYFCHNVIVDRVSSTTLAGGFDWRRVISIAEAMHGFAAAADNPDDSGRCSDRETEIRNGLRHDRTHPDHRPAANFQIAADDTTGSDGRPLANHRSQCMLVRI
jgi:hypothetical protein